MMKSLRKSLNGNGNRDIHRLEISTPLPLPSVSKPQNASLPPQKVIRAIASYRPQGPQQLPFQKGDFFYVTGNIETQGDWYDAHNPVTGARGLVPKSMFEEFCKSPAVRTSSISVAVNSPILPSPTSPPRSPKAPAYFAIVLHDFTAERADELDAKSGDCITVVAQSNREWFVAKPIGRLGRPGLIPASFVEVRNPTTNLPVEDINALIDSGDLPGVEEWKKAVFNYKANSISLGVIEEPSTQRSSTHSTQPETAPPPRTSSPVLLPEGILLSADVVSFHNEMDEYWFRTDAIYQPYDPHDPQTLPKAKQLVLFRVYNDFFDFQVNLLQAFSREAGREPDSVRILPFMPGPAEHVDDEITAARREELDEYLHKLCALNTVGASYILEHQLVREFLSLKPGDVEHDIDPRYDEVRALFAEEPTGEQTIAQEFEEEVRDTLGEMKLSDRDDRSEGSDYGEDHTPPTHNMSRDSQTSATPQPHRPNTSSHHRTGSRSKQNGRSSPAYPRLDTSRASASSRSSFASNSAWPEHATPSPSSPSSSHPSIVTSSRSRSLSNATNMNAPPMSAGNSQTAFVKIKIFDRVTDDLIAIRVHPRVTHAELLEKVQARLGGNVLNLRYRHSFSNEFVGIDDDRDLREWLDSTEKHVLYAE